jgi:glycosyltransferase involved in cell wall biosynthesis
MKVLLSAYACEPGKGSEPGIGWNWVRQVGRFHDVWVITWADGREAIKKAVAEHPLLRVRFAYLDLPSWAVFWKRGLLGAQLHYYLWQIAAYSVGRELHRQVGFNLVHHITLGKYWMPSFLALLPVPFIWGPVGGGESGPRTFKKTFGLSGRFFELARELARWLGEHDPFVRVTARRASLGLAATEETAKRMRALGCPRVEVMSQVALAEEEIQELGKLPLRTDPPFRVLSLGRLLHWKGFHLGLEAFAELQRVFPESEYWIVGDGPERKRLEKLGRNLAVADKVRFWGWLPRTEVLAKLAECDVLVHPSLHDSGGWVCLEAMAAGRPVVCLDLGGPALFVDGNRGIRVPAFSAHQVIRDLAESLYRLADTPSVRVQMAKAARYHVRERLEWSERGVLMDKIYRHIEAGGPSQQSIEHTLTDETRNGQQTSRVLG